MVQTEHSAGRLSPYERRQVAHLSWPAAVEQALSVLTGMAFLMITGRISAGSLAAVGTVNTIITLLQAALAMLSTGAAVLTARLTGGQAVRDARDVAEQAILLTLMLAIGLAGVCLAFSVPLLHLLMPYADSGLYMDTLLLLRIVTFSFPGMMGYAVLAGILRGRGDMHSPMIITFLGNGIQLAAAWLLIGPMGLGLTGSGIAMVLARTFSGAAALLPLLRTHRHLPVRLRMILRPVPVVMKRILRLGVPGSLEQVAIQGGYLLQNAMVLTLGTLAATAYHAAFSINNLMGLPSNVLSLVLTTLVGKHLGAGEYGEARMVSCNILLTGIGIALAASLCVALAGTPISWLYTASANTADEIARLVWVLVALSIPIATINCLMSTLRAAGDVRYIMRVCILGVWCVRVPLIWVLLRFTALGVAGCFIAMGVDFVFRTVFLYIRYRKDHWLHISI